MISFYRAMHFSANARSWDRMSSVCPSVTLVDCDHIGWKSWKSLKRAKIEEKLLWTAYRNSPTVFRMVPSPTPYGLLFLEIGGLQLSYSILSQEQVKLGTSNLADTCRPYRANPRKSPIKILEKRKRGRIQGLRNFFGYPLLSQ